MTVRCKFKCDKVEEMQGGYAYTFSAVTSGSVENDAFFEATPSGSFTVSTVKGKHWVEGQEYFIDITPASPAGEQGAET